MDIEAAWLKWMVVIFSLSVLVSCGGGGGDASPIVSEGSKDAPLALIADGSSHAGGISGYDYNYYSFTTTGGSYNISIGGLSVPTAKLMWTLYSDSGFTTQVGGICNNVFAAQTVPGAITCAAPNLPAGTYYLEVYNFSPGTSYSITVAPDSNGYINTPMQLAIETTYSQTISDNGYDYYYFVAPAGGSGTYKIDLSSANADMEWKLYSSSTYSTSLLTCDNSSSPGTESCMTSNLDHGTYYVKVYANNTPAGTYPYTITVTTQGCSEGSLNDPVSLTTGVSHAGKGGPGSGNWSSYGYSYYTFTPTQNTAYLISLTSVATGTILPGLSWELYPTPDFSSGSLGACDESTYTGDIICRTGVYYSSPSFKLTANTQYYLRVANAAASANTYTITVSPYDVSLGCNSGGTTCYDFEALTIPPAITNDPKDLPSPVYSQAPWELATEIVSIGTGTQGFKTTVPKGNVSVYASCFEFTATDLKWMGFSLQMTPGSGSTVFNIYFDSGSVYQVWGPISWDRFVFMSSSSGTHTYEWCYTSGSSIDAAWVDDIELHY
jgi:hypothetical protein